MTILGISAFYHDSAAAIIRDGTILAAAQEERFSRKKNDASFPSQAIRFCLGYAGSRIDELDGVVFYDKPFLKFERLLETYYVFAPRGLSSFLASMPVWMKEKLFLKKIIRKALKDIDPDAKKLPHLLFAEHHLSHSASAYYPSPFNESAILTIDGVGEWATASISKARGSEITVLKEMNFPHSLGLLYSAFTYYCGFEVNNGEYKLMGLASYGNRDSEQCRKMVAIIKRSLVDIREDGSVFLHQEYFSYATGLRMVPDRKWEKLFGLKRRRPEEPLEQSHCNMAMAVQIVTEEIVMLLAAETRRITGLENLCLAGGVALNCVANGKLHGSGLFQHIFIQPAAGDAGGALGAALAGYYIYQGQPRQDPAGRETMQGALLGPVYGSGEIEAVARRNKAAYRRIADREDLYRQVAGLIAEGKVVGWYQGRMEFGPRALGARSILADARNPEMQKKLNLSIKFREGFRPFAPAVMAEQAHEYFALEGDSPYMLLVKEIVEQRRRPLPKDFAARSVLDKLYFQRSDLPAITHVDYSARIQTVQKDTNPAFWGLLNAFQELTGCALLINTSFNVRDEPIVNTPEDAYSCFMRTEMDYLVMDDLLFEKQK